MSDWPRQPPGRGTVLPAGAQDLEFYWEVDATNHVVWHMIYDVGSAKWLFLGGPPLMHEVVTSETTASASYAALTTAGPLIALPGVGGGLYVVAIGCETSHGTAAARNTMSYDIGGTGAVDGDRVTLLQASGSGSLAATVSRTMRKTIATNVTLTAKYKTGAATATFLNRWMTVLPVTVNPS